MLPVPLPANMQPAPAAVMGVMCCSWSSGEPCANKWCYCHQSGIGCNPFCKCQISAGVFCHNPKSKRQEPDQEEGEDDDNEYEDSDEDESDDL